ncbi:MAG: ABC transporter ATP-binding protein [Oscillospiraceae bacterium]
MIKLSRYLKPYISMVLLAVVFLFGQAMMDLNLPNMMSNIVNVGIMQSGIDELAPEAIPQTAYQLMQRFMPQEDAAAVDAAYTPYSQLTEKEQQKIDKVFPEAATYDAMVRTGDKEELDTADSAFSHAGYAFMLYVQQVAGANGVEVGSGTETTADFDLEALQPMLPAIAAAPQGSFDAAIQQSAQSPDAIANSVAATLNKAYYQQMGADIGSMQTGYIMLTGAKMLGFSLMVLVCAVGAGFCFSRIGAAIARDLRRDVFAKVTGFTNTEMDRFSTSSLITRTTNDVTQVQTLYTMGMRMLVYAPIMGIGGAIMALRKSLNMSWVIALAVVVILCVILVLFVVVMPKFKKMQSLIDRLSQVSRENLSGTMVVRAFSNQKFQESRFDKANKDLTQNNLFVNRAIALMMPLMMFVMNAIALLIVWVGADQISQATIQVGDMMAFIQYTMQIVMAFLFIAVMFIMVPRASVSAARINEVLISEDKIKDPKAPKTLGHQAKGIVEFKNVAFRYEGADEDVLHNISFTANPGQTTAFIGSTGSGKSTLINMVPRFYDATEGAITIDGIDIRDLKQHELRQNIGYVPQKGLLFSGTVDENLRLGKTEATEEEIHVAAQIAQAEDFVSQMADGFQSEISQGGTNVSGGQRQRLSIARALVKKAPVYIFDDSFSALDFATDSRLRKAMKPYTQNSTVLVVAQRVSTIMYAEQIIVLDQGRIVGKGTHAELLKTCEEYREIAESQLSKEELA